LLTIKDVTLGFGETILLKNFSIDIAAGEIALITAPSGYGKSTLLSWISGMPAPDLKAQGEIYLDGKPAHNLPIEKRHIGIIFQDPLMFPHLSVADNLTFGLSSGDTSKARKAAIEDTLAAVGMAGLGGRDPLTLSGGQKARLALMRSLLANPKALLLDEPFSGLDGKTREDFATLVKNEIKARNLPVLMVSHDPRDRDYASRPAIALEGVKVT
jgi:putative thiamine transport system ATP-binding protein